ncbi:GNAT family N-acetyltransferase [Streptomyces sp. NPDC001889]
MTAEIRSAGAGDREAVAGLLAAGFDQDPVSGWIFPGEEHRRSTHHRLMAAFFDIVLAAGRIDLLDDGSAVALWLPVPDGGMSEDDTGPAELRAAIDPGNERIETMARLTARVHPKRAHDYLWLIAVDPAHQGRGLGTALLRPALDRCDRTSRPAYLEASSPSSRRLYSRLGFSTDEPPLVLPDGPPVWPMWRDPRTG